MNLKDEVKIVSEEPKITVIGGCNLDMEGISRGKLKFYDSNPGRLNLSPGGVGRNIAENLAKLRLPVRLISALGRDEQGKFLRESSEALGIDMEDSLYLDQATSVYLSILDEKGEMIVAINQMDILEEINPGFIATKDELIAQSAFIVLDANLQEESLDYICQKYGDKKIFVDLVSSYKGLGFSKSLKYIYGLKANLIEMEALLDRKLKGEDDYKSGLEELLSRGVQQVYLTLGENGVMVADRSGIIHVTGRVRGIKSVTGAGDAFLAAAIYSNYWGWDLKHLAGFAQAAALLTLESERKALVLDEKKVENRRKEVETDFVAW